MNSNPIPFQASLNVNDLISLAPQGPALCFLGEGRFAEAAESAEETQAEPDAERRVLQGSTGAETGAGEGFWAKMKKKF